MDRTAEEILDELRNNGTMPTEAEVAALCEAVADGDRATAALDAFEHALNRAGWFIVDVTTDDTDRVRLELVPPAGDDT